MKSLLFLFKSSWSTILVGTIGSIVSAGSYMLALRYVNLIIKGSEIGIDSLLYVIGFTVVSSLSGIFTSYFLTRYFDNKVNRLRLQVAGEILQSDFEKVERHSETIPPILIWDIQVLTNYAKAFSVFLVAVFKILAIWIYMLTVSWQLTLVTIAIFMVIVGFSYVFMPTINHLERNLTGHRNILHYRLEGLVRGMKELSLDIAHKLTYVKNVIGRISHGHSQLSIRLNAINETVTKVSESIILLGLAGTLYLLKTGQTYDSDVLLVFLTLVLFILPSFNQITTFIRNSRRAHVALDQLKSLQVDLSQKEAKYGDQPFVTTQEKDVVLTYRNLQYTYNAGSVREFKVGPMDLDVYRGEILIIKGGNGSGKTTLGKLLTGLYYDPSTRIEWNGASVDEGNLIRFRDLFSASFADSHVFTDLNYIDHPRVKDLARKYIDLFDLENKVSLEDGLTLSTSELSVGQRGRLILLRALLEDKSLYLLDECVANQDPHFREMFYFQLVPALKAEGKTLILISHDDRYFHIADRVITLSEGKLVAIERYIEPGRSESLWTVGEPAYDRQVPSSQGLSRPGVTDENSLHS